MMTIKLTPATTPTEHSTARRGKQRGDATLQGVILWPFVILFFLAIIQYGMVYFGQSVAHDAAVSALTQARSDGGTVQDGINAGNSSIDKASLSKLIQDPSVHVTKTATEVTVSVTGASITWIPFFKGFDINETVTAPVERWVPRS